MALTQSIPHPLGALAPDFKLRGVDDRLYSLASFQEAKVLVVIFWCNHCPYVVAVQERVNALAKEFMPKGVAMLAINSNDPIRYPDDDLPAMKKRAQEQGYVFPYVQDLTQEVARAYDAACTPDPYVYERMGEQFVLRYHGRVDDNWKDAGGVTRRDLAGAIAAVSERKTVEKEQLGSIGCSIKWKV